ncbi:MAG: polysaccharide deacetylase family protein [Candidatus Eremiobacteraeota bacterium]|nr:polysaccharide deacetylase family protein [Candidatus Eremiobacteraeota bacterium]
MTHKPVASLSLDLDNEWSYLKIHGDAAWSSFPSYLDVVVPRVLGFLRQRELRITFFVVGQDAALPQNAVALRSIADAGHEIGNHSFNHEPWLHRYSDEAIESEIALAEEHIERATGRRPIGFRGPGFSCPPKLLQMLSQRGYRYDASTFPTFIGPLARAYYLMKSRLPKAELRRRSALFGSALDGFRSNKPYRLDHGLQLVEIPVTTMPGLRLPIHASYILYLASISRAFARSYFRCALALCKLTATQPSLLLHPLDFLGCEDNQSLAFFPGMSMPRDKKLSLISEVVDTLVGEFNVITMAEHADLVIAQRSSQPLRSAEVAARGRSHA